MSASWATQEVETSEPSATPQSLISESAILAPATSSLMSTTLVSVGGPTNDVITIITSSPASDNVGSIAAAAVPVSLAPSPPTPRAPHGAINEPLNNPAQTKFVPSAGYVVPAPSFSYNVFPRLNSGAGSHQQSQSIPILQLSPPMPASALQPPVPGQSLVNRPSFSYNVFPHVHASYASSPGQQFHPATATTNQGRFQGAKLTPASLQPPVPGQLNPTLSGSFAPQSIPRPVVGRLSTSNNFSFGGNSQVQPTTTDITSNVVAPETGIPPSQESVKTPSAMPANPSANPTQSLIPNSSSLSASTSPLFALSGTSSVISSGATRPPLVPPKSSTMQLQPTTKADSSRSVVPTSATPLNLASSVPKNVQQQQIYSPYPLVPPNNPQAPWLHPPLAGGLQQQHAPFFQGHPLLGVVPPSFHLPMQAGSSLPLTSSPNVMPPGVSTVLPSNTVQTTTESIDPACKLTADSLPPGIDHEKAGEATVNKEADSWTAHKTESGTIYYYNSITGESTFNKPSSFKGEPEKVAEQPTPVAWEKIAGTNWTLITTNDGKKYYYDTKNKVSSWQVPSEVVDAEENQKSNSLRRNTDKEENTNVITEKVSAPINTIITPAVQTGGRDATAVRSSSGVQVPSSALNLIKKKLQDAAGTPVTPTPLPPSSIIPNNTSELNGVKVAEVVANTAQQSMSSKDKVKDINNGEGTMSDSSSDSDDTESEPAKEDCIIQFKVDFDQVDFRTRGIQSMVNKRTLHSCKRTLLFRTEIPGEEEMLKERGVAPFSKWDKELPKIAFDPRFKAVPSYSARRSIFEHFVRTRAEEERKEKRAAQKAAVNGFKQLLEAASEDIDHKTDYQTFKRKWGKDPRFEALDRKERELLLNEKVLYLKKSAEEKNQAERTVAVTSFKSMLSENKDITVSSRWFKVKDSLRSDPRYKSVKHEDREVLFNEYMCELKAAESEAGQAAKAKRDELDKLKEREREMRKRKEREEQEMERIRVKVRRKEAVSSYQALLVETIKDPKASWTESKPKLEKDPQGRATNPDLSEADAEKLFRDHVKDLFERCARDYRSLLTEVITLEATTQDARKNNALNSWSEAKHLLKPDPRYSKMPRKERESLWSRYADDLIRKQKAAADPKERAEKDGRGKSSSDLSRRSPRSHGRR